MSPLALLLGEVLVGATFTTKTEHLHWCQQGKTFHRSLSQKAGTSCLPQNHHLEQ